MRSPLVLVPLLLVLSGCSGGAEPVAGHTPTPTVSPTAEPTPSATPSPTPTAAPTPSATPARRIPALDGDVDGDGTRDSVRSSATLLTVELSSGSTVTAPINADAPRSAPILGYADIDRDGRSEIFLETAQGASTQFATPYRYDGKVLRELQLEGGPARLGIGGSVTHGEGFRCSGGKLEVLNATSEDGSAYTVHVLTYRVGVTDLELLGTRQVQAKQGDALVDAAYSVACGSVVDGG